MGYSTIVGVIVFVISGLILYRLRAHRIAKMSNISDEAFRAMVPIAVSVESWVESRKAIAQIWAVPYSKLDPTMEIKTFGEKVTVLGDSDLDSETIVENLSSAGVLLDEFIQATTLGKLIELYVKVVEKNN